MAPDVESKRVRDTEYSGPLLSDVASVTLIFLSPSVSLQICRSRPCIGLATYDCPSLAVKLSCETEVYQANIHYLIQTAQQIALEFSNRLRARNSRSYVDGSDERFAPRHNILSFNSPNAGEQREASYLAIFLCLNCDARWYGVECRMG